MKYIIKASTITIECDTKMELLKEVQNLKDFGFTDEEIVIYEGGKYGE